MHSGQRCIHLEISPELYARFEVCATKEKKGMDEWALGTLIMPTLPKVSTIAEVMPPRSTHTPAHSQRKPYAAHS